MHRKGFVTLQVQILPNEYHDLCKIKGGREWREFFIDIYNVKCYD